MSSEAGLERRVTRLENDRDAIYDLLTQILDRLDRHDARHAAAQ